MVRVCLACSTRYPYDEHACPKCASHAGTVEEDARTTRTTKSGTAGRSTKRTKQ